MKLSYLFICGALLSLSACKKKEKATPAPTKTDYLTAGQWKLTSATAGGGVINLMSSMKDCQTDNLYTFNKDKTITVDEGSTKCSSSAPQTASDGNWSLQNNDAQMTISGGTITAGLGTLTGDVVTLDQSTLSVKKDTTFSFPTTIVIRFTNQKK